MMCACFAGLSMWPLQGHTLAAFTGLYALSNMQNWLTISPISVVARVAKGLLRVFQIDWFGGQKSACQGFGLTLQFHSPFLPGLLDFSGIGEPLSKALKRFDPFLRLHFRPLRQSLKFKTLESTEHIFGRENLHSSFCSYCAELR